MSEYPVISDLQKIIITIKNNSSTPKTFNLQGNMTGQPFVDGVNKEYELDSRTLLGSPTRVILLHNNKLYIGSNPSMVYVIDANTGVILSSISTGTDQYPSAMVIYGDTLFVGTGRDSGLVANVVLIDLLTDTSISTTSYSNSDLRNVSICGNSVIFSNSLSNSIVIVNKNTFVQTTFNVGNRTWLSVLNEASGKCVLTIHLGAGFIEFDPVLISYTSVAIPTVYGVTSMLMYSTLYNSLLLTNGGTGNNVGVYNPLTLAFTGNIVCNHPTYKLFQDGIYTYIGTDGELVRVNSITNEKSYVAIGILPLFISKNVYDNTLHVPCSSSSALYVVDINNFNNDNVTQAATDAQPFASVVYTADIFFVTCLTYLDKFDSVEAVVFDVDGADSMNAWSEELSYEPICIAKTMVDNGNSRESLTYGLEYGYKNPSGDDKISSVSLLRYLSADQLANLVEIPGPDLPQCILDGMHYISGTLAGGDTYIITFWYRQLSAEALVAGNDYGFEQGTIVSDNQLKTGPLTIYEKRKEQVILSKVTDLSKVVIKIKRHAK